MAVAALIRSIPAPRPAATHGRRFPTSGGRALRRWYGLYLQRSHLAELDDHMLRDIGITIRQADAEARKPFWR